MPSIEDKKSIGPVFTDTDPNIVMRSGAGSYLSLILWLID